MQTWPTDPQAVVEYEQLIAPVRQALLAGYDLNLPIAKARGFQTYPRGYSRGPFRPRMTPCIAPTLGAPEPHLPARFPRDHPKMDAGQLGVFTNPPEKPLG